MDSVITKYPEFLGALVLAFTLLATSARDGSWPEFLAQPASNVIYLLPEKYLNFVETSLLRADWKKSTAFGDFSCAKIYLPLLALFLAPFQPLPIVMAIAALIFVLPDALLALALKKRQKAIRDSLPQALDLLVLCVDAGLGLDAALQRVSHEGKGLPRAINEELSTLGREIFLGKDRERAYMELYNRTGVDELKTLGSALNQASKLGLSIAKILRAQSEFIRKKQAQQVEEKAMKMPVYMAFPLWFCIMPSLMLLVLGPSLIKFYQNLHGAL